jgi:transposase
VPVLIVATAITAACGAAPPDGPRTTVSIEGRNWLIDGRIVHEGSPAEGLLLNVRMVNTVLEDLGPHAAEHLPDFDPDTNTDRFIARIPDYHALGVRALTVSLQGGHTGYEQVLNSAFDADGTLRPAYMNRVAQVIDASNRHGVVVILSAFYQRQHWHDRALAGRPAMLDAVANVARWIADRGDRNVLLEISNEYSHGGFRNWRDDEWMRSPDGQVELIRHAKAAAPGLLVSTSDGGHGRIHDDRRPAAAALPAAQGCPTCADAMGCIGVDVTRRLTYVPGHFVEQESHRRKYACARCKDAVITAPPPPQVLPRCAADASLLAHVVVSKFADHTPLHRLHRIYARSGADLAVSTLADWVAGVGTLVEPLVERLAARVRAAYIVRTDATGLKVLDPRSPEHIELGSIWAYVGDDRDVVFRYTPTGEGATGPWTFLAGRTGYIQADAATVFDRLFTGQVAHAIEVGCLAHGRRRLVALQDMDCRVAYPLKLIARAYRIEHLADARALTPDERAGLRRARTAPVLERLQRWCVVTRTHEPPSTDLARAAGYFVNHWTALTRFLDDGRLSPDNNVCESQLRDIALGRRNYLFAGSHDAGRRAAALYSLVRTCTQHGVPPLPYLTDVLTKLSAARTAFELDALLPDRWSASTAALATPCSSAAPTITH